MAFRFVDKLQPNQNFDVCHRSG
ncbi:hypothetical protein CCACVL1_05586 [Corchorus capsularis]|uniref:Uncharacterized protein n=1 Tax=Corchorus capsularis TaxID=210143 RepID=A0A1R3JJX5_COCAP|nr:hypothetical protein CCACVL1_05586 [Corchorus capsularis]